MKDASCSSHMHCGREGSSEGDPWLLSHPVGPSSRPLKVYVVPRATSVPSTIPSEGLGPYPLGILRCAQCCPGSDFKTLSPPPITAKLFPGNSSTRVSLHYVQKGFFVVVAEWNAIWFSWREGLGMAEGPPAQAEGWVFLPQPVSSILLWTAMCLSKDWGLFPHPPFPLSSLAWNLIRAAGNNWKPTLPRCSSYKKDCSVWHSCCHCRFSWPTQDFDLLSYK